MRTFDPIQAGRAYRILLQAAANPGKLFDMPPAPDASTAEAILLTLLDGEVTFHALGPNAPEVAERLARATGARVAPAPEADFVLVLGSDSGAAVLELRRGTLEAPEDGATVVYAVGCLKVRGSLTVKLSGPGVPGERTLGVEGLDRQEVEGLRKSRASYPLGVDVYLADEAGLVAGLPRSTRLEVI